MLHDTGNLGGTRSLEVEERTESMVQGVEEAPKRGPERPPKYPKH